MKLTDRDRSVLYDLFHFRVLTTSLICERRFGSLSRGRARLRLLFHHGYVDRHVLPSVGAASGEAIYSLGPAAVAELATSYGLEPLAVKRRRKKVEPFFLAHRLLVATFRSRLGFAGAPAGVGLHDWREEAEAALVFERRDPKTGELRAERLIPDGMAWLKSRKARFAFCLEADRGTMTVGRVRAKFDRYAHVQEAGIFRQAFGADRFRVLVIAPSDRRLTSLKRAAEESGLPSVWLTTEASLARDLVFEELWQRAGKDGRFSLFLKGQVFDQVQTPDGPRYELPNMPNDTPQRRKTA